MNPEIQDAAPWQCCSLVGDMKVFQSIPFSKTSISTTEMALIDLMAIVPSNTSGLCSTVPVDTCGITFQRAIA